MFFSPDFPLCRMYPGWSLVLGFFVVSLIKGQLIFQKDPIGPQFLIDLEGQEPTIS